MNEILTLYTQTDTWKFRIWNSLLKIYLVLVLRSQLFLYRTHSLIASFGSHWFAQLRNVYVYNNQKKSLALCKNFSFCSFQHTIEGRNVTQLPSTTRYLLTVIPALSMRTITLVMTLLINNSYHLTLVYDEIYNKISKFNYSFSYGTLFCCRCC